MISIEKLHNLISTVKTKLNNGAAVGLLHQEILGRKGIFNEMLKDLPVLPAKERREIGLIANQTKQELLHLLSIRIDNPNHNLDLNMPIQIPSHGHKHPVQSIITELYRILGQQGFAPFITPEIESEISNFDTLLIPATHPARDMQDTFWTRNNMVMRTHTTAFQHDALLKFDPPFAVMQGGKIYRAESEDATHLSEFHQFDFFAIAEYLSFKDLKGLILHIIRQFFGDLAIVRFRPSFFPFVEPGAEMDIQCSNCMGKGCKACSYKGWLEILGCGMTHSKIINSHGLDDNKYQGIACGIGIERIAMIKYSVDDIREFTKNEPRFLESIA